MRKPRFHISFENKLRILFAIVLLEFGMFILSGASFSFLHGNPFFSINVDPVFWFFYLPGLPQFITENLWLGILLDASIVLLLLRLIQYPFNNRNANMLFILLMLFYVTFMGYHAHRNFQAGFFMVFIPFLFKKESNKFFAFEATRYYLLFFYVSAAILKLYNNALMDPAHFSNMLSSQFTPYFLEGNTGIRTSVNLYLTDQPAITYILYLTSFFVEFILFIGFFTKKFDHILAILILIFHFANWFLMDIAPFGQIAFICLLFLSNQMSLPKPVTEN